MTATLRSPSHLAPRLRKAAKLALCVAGAWLALALSPQGALACPACAGRQDGGVMRGIMLSLFILFPFVIVAVVVRFIRSASDDGPTAPPDAGLGLSASGIHPRASSRDPHTLATLDAVP